MVLKDTVDKPVTNPKKNRGKLNRALRMVGVPQMLIWKKQGFLS